MLWALQAKKQISKTVSGPLKPPTLPTGSKCKTALLQHLHNAGCLAPHGKKIHKEDGLTLKIYKP